MDAQFYVRLGAPGLVVRYAPKEAALPEPVTTVVGPEGPAGPEGPPGPTGDAGIPPDIQDLTLLFNNALI